MPTHIAQIALIVPDYDQAIAYYTGVLGFVLLEDKILSPQKRWVRVAPHPYSAFSLLLAKATTDEQHAAIGNQTGGRVFLFLHTDDFDRDYQRFAANGAQFVRDPEDQPWGRVAVFEDLYGNLWDLIGPL